MSDTLLQLSTRSMAPTDDLTKDVEISSHLEGHDPWGLNAEEREFLDSLSQQEKQKAVRKVWV